MEKSKEHYGDVKYQQVFLDSVHFIRLIVCAVITTLMIICCILFFGALDYLGIALPVSSNTTFFMSAIISSLVFFLVNRSRRYGAADGKRYLIYFENRPAFYGCERVELDPWPFHSPYSVVPYYIRQTISWNVKHAGLACAKGDFFLQEGKVNMPAYLLNGSLASMWGKINCKITKIIDDAADEQYECGRTLSSDQNVQMKREIIEIIKKEELPVELAAFQIND